MMGGGIGTGAQPIRGPIMGWCPAVSIKQARNCCSTTVVDNGATALSFFSEISTSGTDVPWCRNSVMYVERLAPAQ